MQYYKRVLSSNSIRLAPTLALSVQLWLVLEASNFTWSYQLYHIARVWYTDSTVNFLKCLNTFICLFLNRILAFSAGIHQMLVRIAIMEHPDQTAV